MGALPVKIPLPLAEGGATATRLTRRVEGHRSIPILGPSPCVVLVGDSGGFDIVGIDNKRAL